MTTPLTDDELNAGTLTGVWLSHGVAIGTCVRCRHLNYVLDDSPFHCPECSCLHCDEPRVDAYVCRAHRDEQSRETVTSALRYARGMVSHPQFIVAHSMRIGLLVMGVALGARSGPIAAAVAAVIASEVGGYLALRYLEGTSL